MPGLGMFQPAVLGMSSQSHALNVISTNIANVTTNGYKRVDTNFQTVLSGSMSFRVGNPEASGPASVQTDLGGVRPRDRSRISLAGEYKATGRALDLAVGGRGFFVLRDQAGDGGTVYGRDGSLFVATVGEEQVTGADGTPITVGRGYLVDKNGHFLQGWATAADGSISPGAPLTDLRIDPYAFLAVGQPTTSASLRLNLPAQDQVGDVEIYDIDVFDSAARQQPLQLSFSKLAANQWAFAVDGAPIGTLQFDSRGLLTPPLSYAITAAFANDPLLPTDDTTAQFTLDLSGFTQYDGGFVPFDYTQDGYGNGALIDYRFAENGDVIGIFDNGRTRPLYRLALADFVNPDGLEPLSGNVFVRGADSGPAVLGEPGSSGLGRISPSTLEQSNVDLAGEFSRMILTQNAYNSAATAFRTLDEMSQTARDLA